MSDYAYENLKKGSLSSDPGLGKVIYGAPVGWFAAAGIKKPTAAAAAGDEYTISDDHVFEVGKGFITLYSTLDTGEFTAEMVGDRDSRTFNPKLVYQNPGLNAEKIEFANKSKDDDWIFLVPLVDGTVLQLGTELLPCEVMASLGSGKTSGGYKGASYEAETFGSIYEYKGTIELKPVV